MKPSRLMPNLASILMSAFAAAMLGQRRPQFRNGTLARRTREPNRRNEPRFDRRGCFSEDLYFARRDSHGPTMRLYRRPPGKPSSDKKRWHGRNWIYHYNGFGQLIRKERVE